MKQSNTNEQEIMNYLHALHKNPKLDDCITGPHAPFGRPDTEGVNADQQTPDRSVINNILNYARALDAFKTRNGETLFMLSN